MAIRSNTMLSPRRPVQWTLAVFLAATILSTIALLPTGATAVGSFPVDSAGSWNPKVPCSSPWIVRVSDITDNMTGTSSYNNSSFSPGIKESPPLSSFVTGSQGAKRWLTPGATPPGWYSPGPSCTITNKQGQIVAAFVEIDGLGRGPVSYNDCRTSYDMVNGGSSLPPGHWCDSSQNLFDPSMVPSYSGSCTSAADPTCWGRIHTEFDGDWLAAGYCGTGTVCDNNTLAQQTTSGSATTLIDVQGYVFWDAFHTNETWHSFSGWELHPLTAWRIHNPDFGITANPTTMNIAAGSSGTSTITINSIDFSSDVSLTATVQATSLTSSLSPAYPSASLNPTTVTPSFNGSTSATLTISTSLLTTPGTYTVTVDAVSGSISHSTTVTVTVGLPV